MAPTGITTASTDERAHIGVIGGGAWGTALAIHCARAGHASLIWALEAEVVRDINDSAVRQNSVYLKAGPCRLCSAQQYLSPCEQMGLTL